MKEIKKYRNPVRFADGKRRTNPDPFVMRWCGKYYCYATDEAGVKVSISDNLTEWEFLGYGIREPEYKDYWAPSVYYDNGKFYMYYSNIAKEESDNHCEWLKLAIADKPEGPFIWKKTFFNKFSIDSHPVVWSEKLYMMYSVNDWIGGDEKVAGTVIVADEMITPEEFSGNPKIVLLPSLEQEIFEKNRFGDGRDWYTIEGAATVTHGERCYLTYSANAYVNVDYFVGTAVAEKKTDFMDMEWKKYPSEYEWYPLLHKNEKVEGTGHNTIVKAPNLIDDWIVYHGRMVEEELVQGTEQREMRIDPLFYSGNRMICEGPSWDEKKEPYQPSVKKENIEITTEEMLAKTGEFYIAEYWIAGKQNHIGCKYEIYLAYYDEDNYVKLVVHNGQKYAEIIECTHCIERSLIRKKLPEKYDYRVPHLIHTEKVRENYKVQMDERLCMEAAGSGFGSEEASVGIKSYFTSLTLYSFSLTEAMRLMKKQLFDISLNYQITNTVVDENGLQGKNREIKMKDIHFTKGDFVEEIQFCPDPGVNAVCIKANGKETEIAGNKQELYSVYRVKNGNEIKLIVDGNMDNKIDLSGTENYSMDIKNTKIVYYQYTKI